MAPHSLWANFSLSIHPWILSIALFCHLPRSWPPFFPLPQCLICHLTSFTLFLLLMLILAVTSLFLSLSLSSSHAWHWSHSSSFWLPRAPMLARVCGLCPWKEVRWISSSLKGLSSSCLCVYAHARLCVCVFGDGELMLFPNVCIKAQGRMLYAYVCVCVHVCVHGGGTMHVPPC